MEEALKTIGKQLTENFTKQPGWAPLLVITYLVLYFGDPRLPVVKSVDFWSTLLTFIFYQIGDALDKITFKKRDAEGKWHDRFPITKEIEAARTEFGVKDGIYDVSMKILEKAGRTNSVHFLNESAKTFRSVLLPLLGLAIWYSWKLTTFHLLLVPIALALLGFYVFAWQVYPRWKNLHRIKLYEAVVVLLSETETKGKITCHQLGGVRLFFWEGSLVATAAVTAPVGRNIVAT